MGTLQGNATLRLILPPFPEVGKTLKKTQSSPAKGVCFSCKSIAHFGKTLSPSKANSDFSLSKCIQLLTSQSQNLAKTTDISELIFCFQKIYLEI